MSNKVTIDPPICPKERIGTFAHHDVNCDLEECPDSPFWL